MNGGSKVLPALQEIASPVRYRSCLISTSSSCGMKKLRLGLMTENSLLTTAPLAPIEIESPDCWGCVRLALPKRPTEALGRA